MSETYILIWMTAALLLGVAYLASLVRAVIRRLERLERAWKR